MAAKKTSRKEHLSVAINATKGEKLVYSVVVQGPNPSFVLVDSKNHQVLLSSNDVDATGKAQRNWPLAVDPIVGGTQHVLTLNFLDAIKYTYTVEHKTASGQSLTIIDIDFTSTQHEPTLSQGLTVLPF